MSLRFLAASNTPENEGRTMAVFKSPPYVTPLCVVALVLSVWSSCANAEPSYYAEDACAGMPATGFYETIWRVSPRSCATDQALPQAMEMPTYTSEWMPEGSPVREELPTMEQRSPIVRPQTSSPQGATVLSDPSPAAAQPKNPWQQVVPPKQTSPPQQTRPLIQTPPPPQVPPAGQAPGLAETLVPQQTVPRGMRTLPALPSAPSAAENTAQPMPETTRTSPPQQMRALPTLPSTTAPSGMRSATTPANGPIRSTQPNAPSMPATSTPDEVPFPSVPTPSEGGRMLPWNRPAPDLSPANPYPYGSRADVAAVAPGSRSTAGPWGRPAGPISARNAQPAPGEAYLSQGASPAAYYTPQSPMDYSMPRVSAPGLGARPALSGYCPVALVDDNVWVSGDPRYSVVHRGTRFLTAGPEQQQCFLAEPERYSPVFGGHDPVLAVEEGRQVPGLPEFSTVFDGRLYLFSSAATLSYFRENAERFAP